MTQGSRLFANDPPLNDLKKSDLAIWSYDNGHTETNPPLVVPAWEMNCEEDDKVLFYFRLSNHGAKRVRIVHIQPWVFDATHMKATWKVVEYLQPIAPGQTQDFFKPNTQAAGGWRADNDSNAFLLQSDRGSERWDLVPPDNLHDGWMDIQKTVAHMEWHNPEIHFEVRSVDRR
jgi:hypothetical protein